MAQLHYVGVKSEIPAGSRKIVQIGRKSVGVFNVSGEFFALLNLCPHQFAPLCQGRVCGYSPPSAVGEFRFEREGEIVRCPWHGWEFDIKTGRSIFNPHRVRTQSYEVHSGAIPEAGEVCEPPDPSVETFPVEEDGDGLWVRM